MMARFAMVRALSHGKEAQQERRRKTAKKYQVVSHPNHKRNCRLSVKRSRKPAKTYKIIS
jgi:hypothetical protein